MKALSLTSLIFIVVAFSVGAHPIISYSYVEAEAQMLRVSQMLKVSQAQVSLARHERGKIDALWWPQLQADGMYTHLSERIEVRQSLSQFTDPLKEHVLQLDPSDELITGVLDRVGEYTLTFPLIPQDIASVGLTAEWVAFSGGKRLIADQIARRLIDAAELSAEQTRALQQVALVERYYGLVLAQHTTVVCGERYEGLRKHYLQVLRMEEVGMADRAARLLAQVGMEESLRQYEQAQNHEHNAAKALRQLLGLTVDTAIVLSSPLFIVSQLPAQEVFAQRSQSHNYALSTLRIDERVALDQLRMAQSAYVPDIAFFGKHTLYAHGMPSNLFPRTIVGVGFTWNLFDGLKRERQISQAHLTRQSTMWSREQLEQELSLSVSEFYATLQQLIGEVRVLDTTISLSEELLRVRQSAFAQGMATSVEVIDATHALASAKLARLTAYYAYDVALAGMLMACGMMDDFQRYASQPHFLIPYEK